MSENIPYIIAENGYYYVAYKEKVKVPEIVVSAKGVANGLSEEYNDGWDFGPDSYSPTSTSAIPYTQTSGINEMLPYLVSKGGGRCEMKAGEYYIHEPILYPSYLNNNGVNIPIIVYGSSPSMQAQTGGIGDEQYEGATKIITASDFPYGTNYMWYDNNGSYYTELTDIDFLMPQATSLSENVSNGIALANGGTNASAGFYIRNVRVISGGLPSSMTYYNDNTGLSLGITAGYPAIIENVVVQGFFIGARIPAHAVVISLFAWYCHSAMQLQPYDHPPVFYNCAVQACNNVISAYGINQIQSISGQFSIEWFTSGNFAWSNFLYDPGNYITGHILLTGHGTASGTGEASIPISFFNNTGGYNLWIEQPYSLRPSITTPSVPASGTSIQNTMYMPVKVYINGGAITEIQITINGTSYTVYSNSTASAVYEGFTLPAGASITLTYTTAPTWDWVPE